MARSSRRQRRAARRIFRRAARDLKISRLELAQMVKDGDEDALAAVATCAAHDDVRFDWSLLLTLIIAIAELLLKFFSRT